MTPGAATVPFSGASISTVNSGVELLELDDDELLELDDDELLELDEDDLFELKLL